ncbi:STAS domain-containing protein [Dactylosporangium sp. CA-139066]|uniref:STAS domain-containing protein n=1 Tax=Dactylosporangium sp. CA-139066 TaxID=3239930 RepID=UPI003D8A7D3C
MTLSISTGTGSAGEPVIALDGDLDQTTAAGLREALADALEAKPAAVHVDLTRVTFIDSSGLGALVRAHQYALGLGCRLTLDGVSDTLYERLQIAGVADLLAVRGPTT